MSQQPRAVSLQTLTVGTRKQLLLKVNTPALCEAVLALREVTPASGLPGEGLLGQTHGLLPFPPAILRSLAVHVLAVHLVWHSRFESLYGELGLPRRHPSIQFATFGPCGSVAVRSSTANGTWCWSAQATGLHLLSITAIAHAFQVSTILKDRHGLG